MVKNMSSVWQNVPLACAPWRNGSYVSDKCNTANNNLIASAYYVTPNGKVSISSTLTDSIRQGLWANPEITL